jgi:hypothetical protein
MKKPLMPKATAVWLIENTTLTFDQIAEFCGLHKLEVQGIADGDVAKGIVGVDPVTSGQVGRGDIERCEKDHSLRLNLSEAALKHMVNESKQAKGGKYTPVARRQEKPDAIAWVIKNCPDMSDAQIMKLVGTTKTTIEAVRSKDHWNSQNIRPRDPVLLGLCTQTQLNKVMELAMKKAEGKRKEDMKSELDTKEASSN